MYRFFSFDDNDERRTLCCMDIAISLAERAVCLAHTSLSEVTVDVKVFDRMLKIDTERVRDPLSRSFFILNGVMYGVSATINPQNCGCFDFFIFLSSC